MRKFLLVISSLLLVTNSARADHCGPQICGVCPAPCVAASHCGSAVSCCPPVVCGPVPKCEPQFRDTEVVVYEPQMVNERRTICTVECRPEERVRQVTVYNTVTERRQVPCNVTVMVPEVRRRTESWTECRQVWEDQVQTQTVMVPHVERRQGFRTVCRPVQARGLRTVCEDRGHWEQRPIPAPPICRPVPVCHPCGGVVAVTCCPIPCPPRFCRVWVPNIVRRQVEYTYCRMEYAQEPCEYSVTVCRPEQRQCSVRVCRMVAEPKSREVEFTVCVPRVEQRIREVVEHRCVPTQREERFTVMVPHEVKCEVDVQVCRMVPRRVVQRVPVYQPCCVTICDPCCY